MPTKYELTDGVVVNNSLVCHIFYQRSHVKENKLHKNKTSHRKITKWMRRILLDLSLIKILEL